MAQGTTVGWWKWTPILNIAHWLGGIRMVLSNLGDTPFKFSLSLEELMWIWDAQAIEDAGLLDGLEVTCRSAEGFIQGLKCPDAQRQLVCFDRCGKDAKTIGREFPGDPATRMVYLQGLSVRFGSPEHRALVEWAIVCKFAQNADAQEALRQTWSERRQEFATMTHNLGRYDPKPGKTSLWKTAFLRILNRCRDVLFEKCEPSTFTEILVEAREDRHGEAQFYPPPK